MVQGKPESSKSQDDLIDWFTVSYRSIYLGVGMLLALLAGGYYMIFHRALPPPTSAVAPVDNTNTAHFTITEGTVTIKPLGSVEWIRGDARTVLRTGDLVRTGSGASATIEFFDQTAVQMRPDSLLTIEESSEDPRTKQRRVALGVSSGDVSYNKPASSGSTQVSTPTVKVTQGAGVGAGGLRVEQGGETDVRVLAGADTTVETRAGGTVALRPNEALRVDAAGKPGQTISLPLAPVLLAPPHQAEISYPDPSRGTTLLVWKAVPGAGQYRVMVSDTASFTRPIADERVKETQVPVRGLDVGKYYWRVAALSKDSLEGSFSDFSRFAVLRSAASAGTPPPLQIDSVDVRTNILQIKGRSEPGATVTVNGQRIEVRTDGTFNEFVTLDKPGQQVVVVRASGLNGGLSEERRSVVVAPF